MGKLNIQAIRAEALQIVQKNPGGIRYGQLLGQIQAMSPETPKNTIQGAIWNLDAVMPGQVKKPSRGLFQPVDVVTGSASQHLGQLRQLGEGLAVDEANQKDPTTRLKEQDFYEPFADFLMTDLGEVTEVVALGGAVFKSKWGTPDVLGVYKPLASNLVKFPLEIVSAEIKTDSGQPVVAFGQAVAYRLFSAKTYIAMPTALTEEDQSRLESLCMLFGVGLVLFDLDLKKPNFVIRMRAQRFSPDMFYVNELADRLKLSDSETFEKLFR